MTTYIFNFFMYYLFVHLFVYVFIYSSICLLFIHSKLHTQIGHMQRTVLQLFGKQAELIALRVLIKLNSKEAGRWTRGSFARFAIQSAWGARKLLALALGITHFPSLSYIIELLMWLAIQFGGKGCGGHRDCGWGSIRPRPTWPGRKSHCRRALHRMGVPLDQAETLFDIIDSNKMGEAQMDHDGRSRNQFLPQCHFYWESCPDVNMWTSRTDNNW